MAFVRLSSWAGAASRRRAGAANGDVDQGLVKPSLLSAVVDQRGERSGVMRTTRNWGWTLVGDGTWMKLIPRQVCAVA